MSHKRNEALRHVQHSMHHVIAAGEGSDRAPDSCKLCPYYRPDFKFRTCLYAHCPYKKQVNVFRSTPEKWDILYSVMDGGQLDASELTIQEAREQILEAHHMEKGRRLLQDYDAVMDKVAEAEELSAGHRPSTLEKLAELASDTSAPKSSARSAPEL